MIDSHAQDNSYVFGHSEQLSASLGYWVFIMTLFADMQALYGAQIAIGVNGRTASRFYENKIGWTLWNT